MLLLFFLSTALFLDDEKPKTAKEALQPFNESASSTNFGLFNAGLPPDIETVTFLLKWTLPLVSKRITILTPTTPGTNITSSDSGENTFSPPTTR